MWRFYRYDLIHEYFDRPALAPPLIIFTHIVRLIRYLIHRCSSHNKMRETDFCEYFRTVHHNLAFGKCRFATETTTSMPLRIPNTKLSNNPKLNSLQSEEVQWFWTQRYKLQCKFQYLTISFWIISHNWMNQNRHSQTIKCFYETAFFPPLLPYSQ